MNKIINIAFLITIFVVITCDDVFASGVKFDTLCIYEMLTGHPGEYVFRDSVQLASFLDFTAYEKNYYKMKTMTTKPDFSKFVYIAFAGSSSRTITNISHGRDTVTVNYKKPMPPPCVEEPCPVYSLPLSIVVIYFIPFTEKEIVFRDKTDE